MTSQAAQNPVRLGRARIEGKATVVVNKDGQVYPLTAWVDAAHGAVEIESATMDTIIGDWPSWRAILLQAPKDQSPVSASMEWLPPLTPGKIICIGTNYRDHVAEMSKSGGPPAREEPFPFGFLKPPTTALAAHLSTVALPSFADRLDWEVELALVIGDPAKLAGGDPLEGVFGYTVMIDLSIRDFVPFPHALGMDGVVTKGFDGSAPLGPWITPAEWIGDPQNVSLTLSVNGQTEQDGSTQNMIFDLRQILTHYQHVLTLQTGDVISTGTPAGVGMGKKPPQYLVPGNRVEATVGNLGDLQITIGDRTGARYELDKRARERV